MALILALDTSGPNTCAALKLADGSTVAKKRCGGNMRNEELRSLVEELFAESAQSLLKVSTIRIGSGPGSFTGLRIGYAFAKGLAQAAKCRLVQSDSFRAAASLFDEAGDAFIVAADARREEVFVGIYFKGVTGLDVSRPVSTIPRRELPNLEAETVKAGHKVVHINAFGAPELEGLVPGNIALGLVKTGGTGNELVAGSLDVAAIAGMEPQYIRAVAAKTIEERLQEAQTKQ